MSLSSAFLDEVRARTMLSALIAKRVALSKSGREHKGCCPFHVEKTPSFTVNDAKGFYHCFGCGAHGDAIRWLTDAEGLPFMDAVRQLAEASGIEMPSASPEAAARAAEIATLRPSLESDQDDYVVRAERNGAFFDYLARRGVSRDLAEMFGLGLAGEFGFFRNRLTIPVHNARGRIIGFGGRALRDAQPKYLNSADSAIFDKGRTLFNLHRAAPAARRARRLLIVEGYFDVIALAGVGIAEAVAPMGTAITEAQMARAWQLCQTPTLLLDGDDAGRKAAIRAAKLVLPALGDRSLSYPSLRIAYCPPGQDPDDVARRGGAAAIEAIVAESRSIADVLFEAETEGMRAA